MSCINSQTFTVIKFDHSCACQLCQYHVCHVPANMLQVICSILDYLKMSQRFILVGSLLSPATKCCSRRAGLGQCGRLQHVCPVQVSQDKRLNARLERKAMTAIYALFRAAVLLVAACCTITCSANLDATDRHEYQTKGSVGPMSIDDISTKIVGPAAQIIEHKTFVSRVGIVGIWNLHPRVIWLSN